MQNINDFPSSNKEDLSYQNCLANNEPENTELATQQVVEILDANYKKAGLPEMVRTKCTNLSPNEQAKLLEVLTEFEELFDGTLGDWDTEPVSFQLKDGAKLHHGRAFPVPLSGNVGDMSATCRRRADLLPILTRHACRVQLLGLI